MGGLYRRHVGQLFMMGTFPEVPEVHELGLGLAGGSL